MHSTYWKPVRAALSTFLALVMLLALAPSDLPAQSHVVSPADLHSQLRSAAQERQANLARLERFLSTDAARQAIEAAKLDPAKVRQAVSVLSDQELARLAAQTDPANFAASGISFTNEQVTIIIIGLILIIVVAILVSR